jgi:hypothetical protein
MIRTEQARGTSPSNAPFGQRRIGRKQALAVLLLYAALAEGLLGPLASEKFLPLGGDFKPHLGCTVQARLALEEGQFPLRVAPWEHGGLRYPQFQFYGQGFHTLSGLAYRFLTPHSPLAACKLVLWVFLVLAGYFTFRLGTWLTHSRPAGVVAGAIYLTAPYLLLNLHCRGALPEAAAQCLLPVVLHFVIRSLVSPRPGAILGAGLAWFALAAMHTITFVNTCVFAALLVVGTSRTWPGPLRRWLRVGAGLGLGGLLALYYLAPMAAAEQGLAIHDQLGNPYFFRYLSPLECLLSPTPVAPVPYENGVPMVWGTPYFHPSVGWFLLAAFGAVLSCYLSAGRRPAPWWPERLKQTVPFLAPLLGLFALAFFMSWSPFDVWSMLPRHLAISQFPYRMLAQVTWTGALLGAFALSLLFRGALDLRHAVLGVLLVVLASGSSLHTLPRDSAAPADLLRIPTIGYGNTAYLYQADRPSWEGKATLADMAKAPRRGMRQHGPRTEGRLTVSADKPLVKLPAFYYPRLLQVLVDGRETPYRPVAYLLNGQHPCCLVGVRLPPGEHQVSVTFVGLTWANWASGLAWLATGVAGGGLVLARLRSRRKRLPFDSGTQGGSGSTTPERGARAA